MSYDINKAFLASTAYQIYHADKRQTIDGPNGSRWFVVDTSRETSTGYQGALLKNLDTGKYEMVSRGTEFDREPGKDGKADMQMGFGKLPDQMSDARAFLTSSKDQITRDGGNPSTDLGLVGHSLGGSISQVLGVENPSTHQLAAGVHNALLKQGFNIQQAINFVQKYSPVAPLDQDGAGAGLFRVNGTDQVATAVRGTDLNERLNDLLVADATTPGQPPVYQTTRIAKFVLGETTPAGQPLPQFGVPGGNNNAADLLCASLDSTTTSQFMTAGGGTLPDANANTNNMLGLPEQIIKANNDKTPSTADDVALNPYLIPRVGYGDGSDCCVIDSYSRHPEMATGHFFLTDSNTSQWGQAA